jgi:tripartite-type tricarboxylate transporter receptor subunit TctC
LKSWYRALSELLSLDSNAGKIPPMRKAMHFKLLNEMFRFMTNIDITHVPYKGVSAAMTDVIAGQIQILSGDLTTRSDRGLNCDMEKAITTPESRERLSQVDCSD